MATIDDQRSSRTNRRSGSDHSDDILSAISSASSILGSLRLVRFGVCHAVVFTNCCLAGTGSRIYHFSTRIRRLAQMDWFKLLDGSIHSKFRMVVDHSRVRWNLLFHQSVWDCHTNGKTSGQDSIGFQGYTSFCGRVSG